jgi:hypothetical protein
MQALSMIQVWIRLDDLGAEYTRTLAADERSTPPDAGTRTPMKQPKGSAGMLLNKSPEVV